MDNAFVVGRRSGILAVLGWLCVVVAIGFLAFGVIRSTWWAALPAGGYLLLGLFHLLAMRDHTPVFVADEHGVRMPYEGGWVGLLWRDIGELRVEKGFALVREPRIKLVTADGTRILAAPLGLATDVGIDEARSQLAQRYEPAAY
jgi:hypothetical protein